MKTIEKNGKFIENEPEACQFYVPTLDPGESRGFELPLIGGDVQADPETVEVYGSVYDPRHDCDNSALERLTVEKSYVDVSPTLHRYLVVQIRNDAGEYVLPCVAIVAWRKW